MDKEYSALRLLEKPHPFTNSKISPKLFEYKNSLLELMSEDAVENMIRHITSNGYAEFQDHDRIGFSKDGYTYFDKTYWLQQVYEIVDKCLNKLLKHNDAVSISHKRGVLKIEQKVKAILEDGLTNNLSHKRIEESLLEITETGRSVIEDFGGIENYLSEKEKRINIKNAAQQSKEDLIHQINQLTLSKLKYETEIQNLNRNKLIMQNDILEYQIQNKTLKDQLLQSQIAFNNKKPSWKERNWLWIAIVSALLSGLLGFFLDIMKEPAKKWILPESQKTENSIQEKLDTIPFSPLLV